MRAAGVPGRGEGGHSTSVVLWDGEGSEEVGEGGMQDAAPR